jgi:hypothetical protein
MSSKRYLKTVTESAEHMEGQYEVRIGLSTGSLSDSVLLMLYGYQEPGVAWVVEWCIP